MRSQSALDQFAWLRERDRNRVRNKSLSDESKGNVEIAHMNGCCFNEIVPHKLRDPIVGLTGPTMCQHATNSCVANNHHLFFYDVKEQHQRSFFAVSCPCIVFLRGKFKCFHPNGNTDLKIIMSVLVWTFGAATVVLQPGAVGSTWQSYLTRTTQVQPENTKFYWF